MDRVEVYRNSKLEHRFFPDRPKEEVVDLDVTFTIPRPSEDSWFVVLAYGVNGEEQLSPIYKREPYGQILITTLISLGAQQILSSFGSLIDAIGGASAIGSLLGALELPNSYPNLPFAMTNAIMVNVDGGAWRPPKARLGQDGNIQLPPFCTRPCKPGPEGALTQCGQNQVCIPDPEVPEGGMCGVKTPDNCVGLQPIGS